MKCTHCEFESSYSKRYCGKCGSRLNQVCANCGFENPLDFQFCGDCGVPVNQNEVHSLSPQTSSPKTPLLKIDHEAERRHLTVMFCDLVGSTALSARLDPEDLRFIVTEYQKVCQKVVARFEGHIAQFLGDGILVYFGYPVAHENDAHRAVSAGLAIIEAMEQLNVRLEAAKDVKIQVRIGVHTGHTVVGDILSNDGQNQRLAHGATLNIAARLEAMATPDTMVISWVTYQLVYHHFLCKDQGKRSIKGIEKPVHIYQVIRENTARTRLENQLNLSEQTPIFGREKELNQLLELWEAAKEHRSHIVLLNGEAGVGKSRLLQAMTQKVAEDSDAWLIGHQCSPYHRKTAFYPFATGIKEVALNFEGHESTTEQLNRLEGFLLQNGLPLEETIPLFSVVLDINLEGSPYLPSPYSLEQQREKFINTIITIYLERAKRQPLLLLFEDLHWMDPYSLQVLQQLIQQSPVARLLAVCSFRPDFVIPWRIQRHLIPISMTNLSDKAIRGIIKKKSADKRLPEELIQKIIQKTDGVPLFVEELTKMILNSEMVKEFETHYELTQSIDSFAIPSTLQDSLVARLNNLGQTKIVAQIGAAIGREFDFELLRVTVGIEEPSLRLALEDLVQSEFLLKVGVLPKAVFRFKHALIRDAAYQSLLKSQQKKIHLKIAESLIHQYPEQVKNNPQIAAFHHEKAGQTKEAVIYWTRASEKTRKSQSFVETLDYLQRGLNLIQKLEQNQDRDQLELALLSIQAPVLLMTEGYTSTAAYLANSRMKELAESVGNNVSLFHALRNQMNYQIYAEGPQNAFESAEHALAIAKQEGDQELLFEAYRMIGLVSRFIGKFQDGLDYFDQAINFFSQKNRITKYVFIGGDPLIFCLLQSSLNLWFLGYFDQATQRINEALSKATEKKQFFVQGICLLVDSIMNVYRGDLKACQKSVQAGIKISKEYGHKQNLKEIEIYVGYLLLKKGQISKAHQIIESAFKIRAQRNLNNSFIAHYFLITQAYLELGALQKGLDLVDKAFENFERTGDLFGLPEIYRLKGELLFAKDKGVYLKETEECYETSWKLAKAQGAKSLELRTAMSLARLRQYQNDPKAAFQILSESYGWFTEGFDTADLKEAKILLDNLLISINLKKNHKTMSKHDMPTKTREMHSNHFDSTIWNDFPFRDDDIIIATYAKSGTTWMQQIVSQLIFNARTDLPVAEMSPWMDLRVPPAPIKLEMVEAQEHRRFLKTHLPIDALVFSPKAKYIYIGRDGRDVLWSAYNHHITANEKFYAALNETPGLVGPPIGKPEGDIKAYFHNWLKRDGFPFWSMWDNLNSWWEIQDLPNVQFIHFANLKKDMPGEIRKVASFLEIPIEESNWDSILKHCSFEYMKEHADASVPLGGALWEGGAKSFIHKGENGRWRDVLSAEESENYERIAEEKLGAACAHWLKTGEMVE